jgi:hypothetical protein
MAAVPIGTIRKNDTACSVILQFGPGARAVAAKKKRPPNGFGGRRFSNVADVRRT